MLEVSLDASYRGSLLIKIRGEGEIKLEAAGETLASLISTAYTWITHKHLPQDAFKLNGCIEVLAFSQEKGTLEVEIRSP